LGCPELIEAFEKEWSANKEKKDKEKASRKRAAEVEREDKSNTKENKKAKGRVSYLLLTTVGTLGSTLIKY
jgi:hypothetical protein